MNNNTSISILRTWKELNNGEQLPRKIIENAKVSQFFTSWILGASIKNHLGANVRRQVQYHMLQ